MNWTRTILDGLAMAAYFNLFAATVALYQPRLMFPSYPPAIIKAANRPPTREENRFYWLWICFGELLPLLLYGAVSAVEGGTTGFWRLSLMGYIQWMMINIGDLLFLDVWLIQKKAKDRFVIPGTEGHPGYEFTDWMKGYALPEHLLQWPLLLCPLMAAAQAGLGLLLQKIGQEMVQMKQHQKQQKIIRLGTHGEDYGSWMSNPVFYMIGGLLTLSAVLAALSFSMFHIAALGILFSVAAAALLALLIWCAWIRKQYAFGGGGMMERVHQVVLSHLDFDGQGQLLEVGCGSGALSIRAALTWPDAQITGMDYWGVAYGYGQAMCEKNAESEGVGFRCAFRHGDANKLDFPDESFDAVVSNYVYHNIMGADQQALLLETLRVLKKGGVFALNDDMKPKMYGDMDAFVQKLRDMGYEDVRLIDTATEVFGSRRRAGMMMLGDSRMLVGRK